MKLKELIIKILFFNNNMGISFPCLSREEIWKILENFDKKNIKIGVLASHSALDVAEGAVSEGFETYLFCEKGREEPYTRYFKSIFYNGKRIKGIVDNPIVLDNFIDLLNEKWQKYMIEKNILFIPNRSFWVYSGKTKIQTEFKVPLVGSRNMLHLEDREEQKDFNYYHLLEEAGIRIPKKLNSPEEIDNVGFVMCKILHGVHRLERGFFTASSTKEYYEKLERLIKRNIIDKKDVEDIRIEKFTIGPVMNFDFFYSPVSEKLGEEPLELLGIDARYETNLDGLVRIPANQQLTLPENMKDPTYIVCGHTTLTIRESLLRHVFLMGEKFVKTAKKEFPPGMIGSFCLQTIIEDDMKPTCYDVAFRIGGGTNIHMYDGHPYANILWNKRMSSGRRTALEIKRAIENDMLQEIVT